MFNGRMGQIAIAAGSVVAVTALSIVGSATAFAATGLYVNYNVTSITGPSTGSTYGGSTVQITVQVTSAGPDLIYSGGKSSNEDQHSLPMALNFTFTGPGGTSVTEKGWVAGGASSITHQIPSAGGQTYTATYTVPTPSVSTTKQYAVSVEPYNATTNPVNTMIHWSSGSYVNVSNGTLQSVNEWQDTDDHIVGTGSTTITVTPPGQMPEVPVAGVLPAIAALGGAALYLRSRRRKAMNE